MMKSNIIPDDDSAIEMVQEELESSRIPVT